MKYIRTNDGKIYLVKCECVLQNGDRQADTIEELCDEFVVDLNGKKIISALTFERSLDYGGDEIYGAIWTDKGLIYVAKMNDKGELELL